ncbi:MAG: putative ABC transporter permease, partial [Candidatus Nomurabacteria bacterium]|nr:putative ABC transporter permease [Candidatus Nomurabacteria bacterium]
LPKLPEYTPNPRSLRFWRDSFLYFWIFSLIGHFLEYPWIWLMNLFGEGLSYPPLFVIAAPYGFGVLGILWFIYPIFRNRKIGIVSAYIYGVLICTAIEFVCALVVFLTYGHNPFWDYSAEVITILGTTIPLNLFGFVCLKNSLAFGVVSLVVLYFLFPFTDNLMKALGQRKLNVIFWVIFTAYMLVHIGSFVTTGDPFR